MFIGPLMLQCWRMWIEGEGESEDEVKGTRPRSTDAWEMEASW
jgi:hypothetical protein